jgi:hypothetical protein
VSPPVTKVQVINQEQQSENGLSFRTYQPKWTKGQSYEKKIVGTVPRRFKELNKEFMMATNPFCQNSTPLSSDH